MCSRLLARARVRSRRCAAGEHLEVLEGGRAVRQTNLTSNFEGAWCLGNLGFSSGQWRCTFSIRRRTRWMAAGFALDSVSLDKPINRSNIFVYASTGSVKANEQTASAAAPPTTTPPPDAAAALAAPASAAAPPPPAPAPAALATTPAENTAWAPFARSFKTDDCVVAGACVALVARRARAALDAPLLSVVVSARALLSPSSLTRDATPARLARASHARRSPTRTRVPSLHRSLLALPRAARVSRARSDQG